MEAYTELLIGKFFVVFMHLGLTGILTWAFCFLVADAHIFGVDTQKYCDTLDKVGGDPDSIPAFVLTDGIVNLRHFLLRYKYFRKLFHCYFCLGFWLAPIAYLVSGLCLSWLYGVEIFETLYQLSYMRLLVYSAFVMPLGAALSYVLNLFVMSLESKVDV